MNFSDQQIQLARMLHAKGLEWQPAVGQFVFDEQALIEVASPFQEMSVLRQNWALPEPFSRNLG